MITKNESRRQRWKLLIDWADIAYFIGAGCIIAAGSYYEPWLPLALAGASLIAWALLISRR